MTLKKKITNFYVAYAAIYSNKTLTNECWKIIMAHFKAEIDILNAKYA